MVGLRAVVAACLLAGLGATFPGPAAAASPCDVLKPREVKKAVGQTVRYTGPADGLGGECAFTLKESPTDYISVWVLEGDDAVTGYENGMQLTGEKVEGIGDKAYYVEDPFNTLYVLDGDTLVYLQYFQLFGDAEPADIEQAVTQMTRKVLARV